MGALPPLLRRLMSSSSVGRHATHASYALSAFRPQKRSKLAPVGCSQLGWRQGLAVMLPTLNFTPGAAFFVSMAAPSPETAAKVSQTAASSHTISRRLQNFQTTIFTQMSSLAVKHQALNLGQGFPNFDGPDFVKDAAIEAIKDGRNQYARGFGLPQLNAAIADRFRKDTGLSVDPETEVTVTSGCTEAIAASMIGLVNSGDEVILFAPFYDSYLATLSMVDATVKTVTLRPPDFTVPEKELREAFTDKTKVIMINTPHNPTGKVFSRKELELIASLCKEYNTLAFTDEVYHRLTFSADHISLASLEGMYERTVTMNSLGKTFSLTGWKIGWAVAPPNLTWGLRQAHAFLTFATATPFQWAAVAALNAPDSFYKDLIKDYTCKKDILVQGLTDAGFKVYEPQGTYFVMVDHTPFGFNSDVEFCKYLIEEVGVVAIPPSVFYLNPEDGKNLVRFTFSKDEDTLRRAVERMKLTLKKRLFSHAN